MKGVLHYLHLNKDSSFTCNLPFERLVSKMFLKVPDKNENNSFQSIFILKFYVNILVAICIKSVIKWQMLAHIHPHSYSIQFC